MIKKYFKNKEIVFLYLGRIMKDKGINEYIKAIETLKNSNLILNLFLQSN